MRATKLNMSHVLFLTTKGLELHCFDTVLGVKLMECLGRTSGVIDWCLVFGSDIYKVVMTVI